MLHKRFSYIPTAAVAVKSEGTGAASIGKEEYVPRHEQQSRADVRT